MPTAQERTDFVILYGSQTGQAEAISEEIYDRSFKEGLCPVRYTLGDIEKKFSLEKLKHIVIVCSTTGEGEPPDNALKFVRRIKKKTLSSRHLQDLSFTILGLGDSNYTNFCNCSKGITARLLDIGATTFYEPGFADDAVGLEEVVEPWIDGLFPVLRNVLKIENFESSAIEIIERSDSLKLDDPMENTSSDNQRIEETLQSEKENEIEPFVNMDSDVKPNLRYSVPPLSESTLKIPASPAAFIELDFLEYENVLLKDFEYPGAATKAAGVIITSARQLTNDPLVKKALEIELNVENVDFDFQPGDSFGIVCQNRMEEVNFLMHRLNTVDVADKTVEIKIMSNTLKKAPSIPKHIKSPTTLRQIFLNDVDFRAVPRKAFLRMLVDYTENVQEKRRLQELCCVQGNADYISFIRENYIGLVQLLQTFPSCNPPVSRLLELLPQLLPREYSVANYSGKSNSRLKFVFNVIELPDFMSSKRFGLCTNWLDDVTSHMRVPGGVDLEDRIGNLKLDTSSSEVKLYFRKATSFRFPDDPSQPLIMIGPGTGVAPFIGFLEKRELLKETDPSIELGPALLFFGCRYHDKDFLYEKELSEFKTKGYLNELYCSFSRDEPNGDSHTKYVQHNIQKHKERVLNLLFEKNGAVFICGDAKFMGRDVTNTFIDLIVEYKSISKVDAIKVLNELRETKQFLEDVWT